MSEKVTVMIACLARVAWADGRLLPAEAEFFSAVIRGLNLSPEVERSAWEAVVSPPADVDRSELAQLSSADRQHILQVSREMAASDGSIGDEELQAIRELAAQLECEAPRHGQGQ